jgi:undecaprenyl-diphosphatase
MVNGLIVFVIGAARGPGQRNISDLGLGDYLIIGVAQGAAALPGISRLGMTLVAGLARGMKWSETVQLSFLLSLPTILAANLYELLDPMDSVQLSSQPSIPFLTVTIPAIPFPILEPGRIIIGLLSVLITYGCGLLALNFLSKFVYVGRRLLVYFGVYCVVAGAFFLFYLKLLH